MTEELNLPDSGDKELRYQTLLPQIKALVQGEQDLIANLSNIMAALKQGMGFFWVGCYFVKEKELVLGPFQGPVACTRIAYGSGVCGMAWKQGRTIIVDDVDAFPGHIACSSDSRSEIVLPVLNADGKMVLILDVDSDKLADFDALDKKYLKQVVSLIRDKIIALNNG